MITYYWCCHKEDPTHWENRLADLPNALQEYILARKTLRQQQQSTYGYWLLQQNAALLGANALEDISFTTAGQPLFAQHSVRFSISHSGTVVGVAVSPLGRIGLDIQAAKSLSQAMISPVFFSAVEQQAIRQATDPNDCLLQFWSKKEALIKAVGGTLLDLGQQTDVRADQTIFQGAFFYWLALPHPYKGVIWLASEHPFDNFVAQKWSFD